jgi:hypothetical protein
MHGRAVLAPIPTTAVTNQANSNLAPEISVETITARRFAQFRLTAAHQSELINREQPTLLVRHPVTEHMQCQHVP